MSNEDQVAAEKAAKEAEEKAAKEAAKAEKEAAKAAKAAEKAASEASKKTGATPSKPDLSKLKADDLVWKTNCKRKGEIHLRGTLCKLTGKELEELKKHGNVCKASELAGPSKGRSARSFPESV